MIKNKSQISSILAVFVFSTFSVFAKDPVAQKKSAVQDEIPEAVKKYPHYSKCRKKVDTAITGAAIAMGEKRKFGVNLNEHVDSAGKDESGKPVFSLSTGAFIVNEGFISRSGATVTFSLEDSKCEILKIEISIGFQ